MAEVKADSKLTAKAGDVMLEVRGAFQKLDEIGSADLSMNLGKIIGIPTNELETTKYLRDPNGIYNKLAGVMSGLIQAAEGDRPQRIEALVLLSNLMKATKEQVASIGEDGKATAPVENLRVAQFLAKYSGGNKALDAFFDLEPKKPGTRWHGVVDAKALAGAQHVSHDNDWSLETGIRQQLKKLSALITKA